MNIVAINSKITSNDKLNFTNIPLSNFEKSNYKQNYSSVTLKNVGFKHPIKPFYSSV